MLWLSGRRVGCLSGQRRTEASSFEVFGRKMDCLTERRTKVSSEARGESYWTSGPGFAGQMLNCSASLGLSPRWVRER